ncbi:hypothetical protein QMN27_12230 [Enterobacter asburiae]|uniref:hypothetical protein n=1 Tax=Enterobacter asburiae TaxID=61645 RepID=UPI002B24E5F3|nr:hypothetical protein [Enterobacter asburiae]MEB2409388.1 hypothetical protein [Enterobacter asburiae]
MFFKNGTLRIGTLFDFKKNEAFNRAIGDGNEGSHFSFMDTDQTLYIDEMTESQSTFLKGLLPLGRGSSITGVQLVRELISEDFYIFCMTTEPSRKAMEEFDCDTCIEIVNPLSFFNAVTKKIKRTAGDMVWNGQITYIDKKYSYLDESNLHPAQTKDIKYSYQKEYRVIWQKRIGAPVDTILRPIFIKVPKAIKHSRLIKL